MIDHELLVDVLRRESRSFLQYVRESYPWASVSESALRDQILALADREAEILARIARLLQSRRVPLPIFGTFPTSYTSSNFLAARALIPRLLEDGRRLLAELDRDLEFVADEPGRQLLEALQQRKREHLQILESMITSAVPAAAASA